MAWVYILDTISGKYYIGSTNDLEKRLEHHKGNHTPSTRSLGFKECVLYQEYKTLKDARKIESRLKRMKRRDYIEKIIKDGYIRISPTLR